MQKTSRNLLQASLYGCAFALTLAVAPAMAMDPAIHSQASAGLAQVQQLANSGQLTPVQANDLINRYQKLITNNQTWAQQTGGTLNGPDHRALNGQLSKNLKLTQQYLQDNGTALGGGIAGAFNPGIGNGLNLFGTNNGINSGFNPYLNNSTQVGYNNGYNNVGYQNSGYQNGGSCGNGRGGKHFRGGHGRHAGYRNNPNMNSNYNNVNGSYNNLNSAYGYGAPNPYFQGNQGNGTYANANAYGSVLNNGLGGGGGLSGLLNSGAGLNGGLSSGGIGGVLRNVLNY